MEFKGRGRRKDSGRRPGGLRAGTPLGSPPREVPQTVPLGKSHREALASSVNSSSRTQTGRACPPAPLCSAKLDHRDISHSSDLVRGMWHSKVWAEWPLGPPPLARPWVLCGLAGFQVPTGMEPTGCWALATGTSGTGRTPSECRSPTGGRGYV